LKNFLSKKLKHNQKNLSKAEKENEEYEKNNTLKEWRCINLTIKTKEDIKEDEPKEETKETIQEETKEEIKEDEPNEEEEKK
jgi:hypothetical protein